MSSEVSSGKKRFMVWNLLALALSLLTVAAFISIRHPRTDQIGLLDFRANQLLCAYGLLTILLAGNAVAYLVFLRRLIVGLVLTLFTGVSVFFLVEWALKLQSLRG